MNQILLAFNSERLQYQKRYAEFYRKLNENPNDLVTAAHLHECAYTLTHFFGLTPQQVQELEKFGGCGLTNFDMENARCNVWTVS